MIGIYARQSIDKKESISIETQIIECKKEMNEGEAHIVYADKGFSGKNVERPEFQKLLKDIKKGLIKTVIVYKVDRISRAIIDFASIMEILDKYNVEFISRNEKFDTTTPIGRAMLTIIMVFAQLERETIKQRITDAYYSRAEQGYYGGGRRPFGYNTAPTFINGKKTKMYVPNLTEAEVLKMLYEKYAEESIPLNTLLGMLNSDQYAYLKKTWSSAALGQLMRNPIYVRANADVYNYLESRGAQIKSPIEQFIGIHACYLYGKRVGTKSKFSDMNNYYVSLAPHEGLIDALQWLKCQHKLDANKQIKGSGKGQYSWLCGLMKCAYCNKSIIVTRSKNQELYATCGGRKNKYCYERKKAIHITDVEEIVEKVLIEHIKSLSVQNASLQQKTEPPELNSLKIQIHKIESEINTYMDKILLASESVMARINTKIEQLERECRSLKGKMEELKALSEQTDYSNLNLSDCVNAWSKYSIAERKAIAKVFIQSIVVSDEEIKVNLF